MRDSLRPVDLVRGEREQVDAERIGTDRDPAERLHRVGVHQRPRVASMHGLGDPGNILDGAHLVVDEHDGNQKGLVGDRGRHQLGGDAAVAVAGGDGERGQTDGLEMTSGLEDRVVLDRGHHHVPAQLRAPALEHAAQREVVRLGARPGEDDLALRASEHRRDPVAGAVHGRACGPAGLGTDDGLP